MRLSSLQTPSLPLAELVAVPGPRGGAIKTAELLDVLERLRRERSFAFEGVEHDALQQITQAHVLLLGHRLQHLQHAFLQPHARLNALHLDWSGAPVSLAHWYKCTMVGNWSQQEKSCSARGPSVCVVYGVSEEFA